MKNYFLIIVLFMCCVFSTNAQVTNLTVNGSDTNFTFESGSAVSWQYNVSPNGATATAELWLDVNLNGSIDTATDKNRFTFTQTDGVSTGDGPPDLDGSANGVITFSQPVGLAPGNYVFKVTQGGASLSVKGTITHLASPAHTVSGTITPPSGKSAANIFMQIQPSGEGDDKPFWEAVTDGSGNFAIEMDADTTGNPWRLRLADNYNPFPGAVITPSEYEFNMIGNPNGYTFSFVSAAAEVVGYLRDDDGNPIPNFHVYLNRSNNGANFNAGTNTDGSGFFEFGLLAEDLSNDDFILGSSFDDNQTSHPYLAANTTIHGIQTNDSLFYNLVAYAVNSTIQGQVRVNGNPPGFPIQVTGNVQDSAWTSTWADSTTGNFSLEASDKLYNYNLFASNLPNNYFVSGVTAHPGDTGVIINITVTGVSERESGIPLSYSLNQNYPNPFNPTTAIDYDLMNAGHVQLSLYNILGKEVLNVVNQEQAAGKYRAIIDASSLSSGIYFYKLQAGQFSSIKKMILMK